MLFENNSISLEELPSLEDIDFQSLETNYLKVSQMGNAIFFGIVLIGLMILIFSTGLKSIWWLSAGFIGVWAFWATFSFWITKKGFQVKGFALREKDITYRSGYIFRSVTTIPFNRVQHCEITEGPIERQFGLKKLEVFTAGGQSSDLVIPGLKGEQAQQLKEYITGQAQKEV